VLGGFFAALSLSRFDSESCGSPPATNVFLVNTI
jgi:hypothetical protein